MTLSFKALKGASRIISPMKNFTPDEIPFEIRFDPLTGETGRVFDFPFRADRPDMEAVASRSREIFCPFCPDALEKSTPLFPEDVIAEGRIRVGEATLIPNLVPFDKYAGVSIFSREHYIPMENLTAETMGDAFAAALTFIKRIARQDSRVQTFTINWNYMPPAGSSMVHPHLQPNCGEVPTNLLRLELEASRTYAQRTGGNFWHDLMETETALGLRNLGEIESTVWLMSFVPLSFLPDICCIFPGKVSLADMGEHEMRPFLKGLAAVLRYFRDQNLFSFNISMLSVRESEDFFVHARICPRLFPRAIGNNDMAYLQAIHKEPFCVRLPESVCPEIRAFLEQPS